MNWTSAAILSAAISGVVNIVDSHLLSRRMPGLRSFLLPVGTIHLIFALVLFFLFPLPENTEPHIILIALLSGTSRVVAVLIMLYNLTSQEVSRVIPVVQTSPVFVAIIAVPLLAETLYPLQWLAIIIVVAGAVMVSMQHNSSGSTTWWGKPFLMLLTSSLLFALADISSKYVLTYISFWNMFYLTAFCISGIFLLVSARPHILTQLGNIKDRSTTLAIIFFNEILAPVAIVLSIWALASGPVSLVSPIVGSRPMFVVLSALILSRLSPGFLKWESSRRILALRLIGTAMIVGGISFISLT